MSKQEKITNIVKEIDKITEVGIDSAILRKMLLMLREGFESTVDEDSFYSPILETSKLEAPELVIGANQKGVHQIDCNIVDNAICSKFKTDSLFYRMKFFKDGEILLLQKANKWNASLLRLDTDVVNLPYSERNPE